MSVNKIDVSTVYEMFEEINKKLDKQTIDKPTEPMQVDMTAINAMTERLKTVIEAVREPTKVEHQHRHTIDIGSSKIFISLIVMALMIIGLSYAVGEQRRSISQYRNNDLKYRYIRMQGQTSEENLSRLERQFQYSDSIKIIRKQVEKYEKLVWEQADRLERDKENNKKINRIQKEVNGLKINK